MDQITNRVSQLPISMINTITHHVQFLRKQGFDDVDINEYLNYVNSHINDHHDDTYDAQSVLTMFLGKKNGEF